MIQTEDVTFPVLTLRLKAAQSQVVKAADGSFMEVIDLPTADGNTESHDGAFRVRFLDRASEGTLIPGHLYDLVLYDRGPIPVEYDAFAEEGTEQNPS